MTAPSPLDHQLCFSLYAANIAIHRTYKPMLDTLGLTYPQYLVLHTLWEKDGRTVGGIAERLGLESSTVTPLVKRLESAGFVARARNPEDERQVRVSLTARGISIREDCGCLGEALMLQSGMTGSELSELNAQIQRLRVGLAAN